MWRDLAEDVAEEFAMRAGCFDREADWSRGMMVVNPEAEARGAVERVRDWRGRNAKRAQAYDRERYAKSAEARKAAAKAYYAANRAAIVARRKERLAA